MVTVTRRQRLNLPIAPIVAALIGGITALAFTLMPVAMLEDFVIDSGVAAVLPAAEPPLGDTARAALIMIGGGGTALIAWFALFLVLGARAIVIQRSGESDDEKTPVLRRADAHPDAPARRPLFANRELGTPFLEVRADRPVHITADLSDDVDIEPQPVERPVATPLTPVAEERALPADLDTPLAAFDPKAIPEKPIDWFEQRTPLLRMPRQQVFDPGERFETFDLTPMRRSTPPASPAPAAAPSAPPAPAPAPFVPQVARPVVEPAPVLAPAPVPTRAPIPIRAPAPAPAPQAAPVSISETLRSRTSARVELDPSASIHALLDRLERGVGRREIAPPPPPPSPPREESLEDTLVALRRLAMTASR